VVQEVFNASVDGPADGGSDHGADNGCRVFGQEERAKQCGKYANDNDKNKENMPQILDFCCPGMQFHGCVIGLRAFAQTPGNGITVFAVRHIHHLFLYVKMAGSVSFRHFQA
jgi:hypothetical protein